MQQDLSNVKWETELTGKSTEGMWIKIKDTITEMVITHVPQKMLTGKTKMNKNPPWVNDQVRQQLKTKKVSI